MNPSESATAGVSRTTGLRRTAILIGLGATLLAAFVRLAPALGTRFPVNDGGLFYVFVREIAAHGFRPPAFSAYNQAAIPFVYPPLSFYLTALLASFEGADLLDLIGLLPPAISILTVPAFYLLARRLLRSQASAAAAVFAFALLPTAFDFMIVGGGLPRALGMLFCLLALWAADLLYVRGRPSHLAGLAIFAALTVLSHPVVAWFMVYSLVILWVSRGANRRTLRDSLIAAALALLLTSPWWATCLACHGAQPFLWAFQAGERSWAALLAPFLFLQTNEPYLPLIALSALLGLFLCLRDRQYLLPVWLVAVFVLEPRLVATYAALPTALLAGIGFGQLVLPALASAPTGRRDSGSQKMPMSMGLHTGRGKVAWVPLLATVYFLAYLLIAAFLAAPRAALSPSERAAMEWVRANTPAGSRFAVISGIRLAGVDYVSEWFPALAERASVATPQGYEWFPGQLFDARWDLHIELQDCGTEGVECVERWAHRADAPFTHIYLVRRSGDMDGMTETEDLYASLVASADYEETYSREGIAVFAYHSAPAAAP